VFFQPYHLIQSIPTNNHGWLGVYNAVVGSDLTLTIEHEAMVLSFARTRPLSLVSSLEPLALNIQVNISK